MLKIRLNKVSLSLIAIAKLIYYLNRICQCDCKWHLPRYDEIECKTTQI